MNMRDDSPANPTPFAKPRRTMNHSERSETEPTHDQLLDIAVARLQLTHLLGSLWDLYNQRCQLIIFSIEHGTYKQRRRPNLRSSTLIRIRGPGLLEDTHCTAGLASPGGAMAIPSFRM